MNKEDLLNIPFLLFLIFLVISFTMVNYDFFTKDKTLKDEIKFYMYEVINVAFIFIFIFYASYHGYTRGIYETLFIWAFLAVCTPVPESGLLISLPLKRYFEVKMMHSQVVISLVGLLILYLFYNYKQHLLKPLFLGRIFNDIMKNGRYLVFIISIVSSIIGSDLIDNIIDKYLFYQEHEHMETKALIFGFLIVCYFFV